VTETIEPMAAQIDQQQLAEDLVAQAREEGVQLVGPGGLLTGLTKAVVETALEEELSDHRRLTTDVVGLSGALIVGSGGSSAEVVGPTKVCAAQGVAVAGASSLSGCSAVSTWRNTSHSVVVHSAQAAAAAASTVMVLRTWQPRWPENQTRLRGC
jgi:fluoride ion exporter CrcB/FEX